LGIAKEFFNYPHTDDVEISLFGTGGGYGESIVIKLPSSNWVIIDSCINPDTQNPLAIDYLQKIGVDLKQDVSLIVCTHWHQDHILGLSKTLNLCTEAKFCIPAVNDIKKFLQFVGLDYNKIKKGSISSTKEFKECLEIMASRDSSIIRASSNKVLLKEHPTLSSGSTITSEINALSPSETVVAAFDRELSVLMDNFRLSTVAVPEKSANEKSVAVFVRCGNFSAILGADLEIGKNNREGWRDIENNCNVISKKAMLYKVPHHGSSNAYDRNIFKNLVDDDAIIKLTPWNKKNKLPEPLMISEYKTHTSKLYITSSIDVSYKAKKRDKSLGKIIKLFNIKLTEMKFREGIIRTRFNCNEDRIASIETSGNAFQI